MDGFLLIDKPSGWTSFDIVAKVRGVTRKVSGQKKPKVGHTGTLDPLATGLLILVLGSYTKRVDKLSKVDKTYDVQMRLGQTSSTGDEEGEKTNVSPLIPNADAIARVAKEFEGVLSQVPPAYSAIKVNGQRAYALARAGKPVELTARTVVIHSLKITEYSYPVVRFTLHVSSGTYIRTLVEDIGKALGTGAYMSGLRRTQVGHFVLQDAHTPDRITPESLEDYLRQSV